MLRRRRVNGNAPLPSFPCRFALTRASPTPAHTSSLTVSVYAAVFVAHSLPQENLVMQGFRDGGPGARDELDNF
jgi:hypothetical protein